MAFRRGQHRRELLAVSAAVLLHALLIVVVSRQEPAETTASPFPAPRPPTGEAEVELELEAMPSRGGSRVLNPLLQPEPALRGLQPRGVARPGSGEPEDVAAELAFVEPDAATLVERSAPANEESPAEPDKPIDLGLGPDGWQRWALAPGVLDAPRLEPSAPRAGRYHVQASPRRSDTGGLKEGLEANDRRLGLGSSGRVVSALHEAAHVSSAPTVGTATFHVTVLKDGAIEIALGSATGSPEDWRGVAEHALSSLKLKPPRIPPSREGVRLVISLKAEETMPNGVPTSSLHGPRFELDPLTLSSVEDEKRELELSNPVASKDPAPVTGPPIKLGIPGVYLSEHGKVCRYRLGVSLLGPTFHGGCDLANLGANPQRMVHAEVKEETPF